MFQFSAKIFWSVLAAMLIAQLLSGVISMLVFGGFLAFGELSGLNGQQPGP